jgi:hypothetical protein
MLKTIQTNGQDPKTNPAIAPALLGIRRPPRKRRVRRAQNQDGKHRAALAIPPASVYFVIEFA